MRRNVRSGRLGPAPVHVNFLPLGQLKTPQTRNAFRCSLFSGSDSEFAQAPFLYWILSVIVSAAER